MWLCLYRHVNETFARTGVVADKPATTCNDGYCQVEKRQSHSLYKIVGLSADAQEKMHHTFTALAREPTDFALTNSISQRNSGDMNIVT